MAWAWVTKADGSQAYEDTSADPDPSATNNPAGQANTGIAPTQTAASAAAPAASVSGSTSGLGLTVGSPQWNGTGQFVASPYPINDAAITGDPTQGASSNYGLNDIYSGLQNDAANTSLQNYGLNAPQATAAQGTAAQGTAATGAAAQYQAAQAAAQGYSAAQGSAAQYQAAQAAAQGYSAAQGSAAQYQAAQAAAQGYSASLASQTPAAQGYGYAAQDAGQTGISTAGDAQFMAQQQALANVLGTQAAGGGVSPADLQLAQGTQQGIAAQLAVLGSQRGNTNAALAQQQAGNGALAQQASLDQQMGIQRANETLSAQQALGNVLGTARGQSQAYNTAQAGLTQGVNLANQAAQNQALASNAAQAQQNSQYNASNIQAIDLANQAAGNTAAQFGAGAANTASLANAASLNQAGQFNAGSLNAQTLANQAAVNQANQFTAGAYNTADLANAASLNQAGQFNAGSLNAQTLANQAAENQASQFTAGAYNTADLANAASLNQAGQFNAGSLNAQTLANQAAENQQTLANQAAAQQTGIANLGNAQSTDLANLGVASSTNLANQSSALAAQQQYYNQLLAISGAQTGIAQANRSASLANQELQVQQRTATNNVNEQAFNTSANANANFASAIANGVAGLAGTGITAAANGGAAAGGAAAGANGPNSTLANGVSINDVTGNGADIGDPGDDGDDTSTLDSLTLNNYQNPYLTGALSDENLKAGVAGGNPMLTSFLDQMRASKDDQAVSAAPAGQVVNPTYQKQTTLSAGNQTGSTVGNTAGSIAGGVAGSVLGGPVGGAVGKALGGFLGGAFGSIFNGPSTSSSRNVQTSPGSFGAAAPEIDDLDSATVMSDDTKKTDVSSGNPALERVLSQAVGALGQSAPAGGSVTQPGGVIPGGLVGAGGVYGGGVTSQGGVGPQGGVTPGAVTSMGGVTPGGFASAPGSAPIASGPPVLQQTGIQVPHAAPAFLADLPAPLAQSSTAATDFRNIGPNGALGAIANSPPPFAQPSYGVGGALAQATGAARSQYSPWLGEATALSDEEQKSEVRDDPRGITEMLDQLHAHEYRYKDPSQPGAGEGTFVSPMAQELEKTQLGKSFVKQTPQGKMVDYGHMAGTMLAGEAMLHERVTKLEKILQARAK